MNRYFDEGRFISGVIALLVGVWSVSSLIEGRAFLLSNNPLSPTDNMVWAFFSLVLLGLATRNFRKAFNP